MRSIIFLIGLVLALIVSLPLLLIAKLTNSQKLNYIFAHNIAKFGNFLAGNKIEVRGLENQLEEPFLLVANHEGIFDLFNIYSTINQPLGFISKKENGKIPLLNLWMKQLKILLMDREDIRQSVKIIRIASDNIKSGLSYGIMPEGTRSTKDMEFQAGSFKIAQLAKAPIVPVTIRNTASIFEENKKIKKGKTLIKYHPAITYEQYKDMDSIELAKMVEELVHGEKFE